MKKYNPKDPNVSEFIRKNYTSLSERAMKNTIEFAREKQRVFIENDGEISGVEFLKGMLDKGILKMDQYIAILPAVEIYNSPYILNINNEKDENQTN